MIETLLIWGATLLYIFPPLWMLFRKGWPIRGGATMLAASLLPLLPFLASGPELPPGAGISALAIAPFAVLAILVICAGSTAALVRLGRRRIVRM